MKLLKIIPDNTNIGFVRIRHIAFAVTTLLTIAALALVFARGLNFGVDFVGGVSIEEKFASPPPLDQVRSTVDNLGLGEASLQQLSDARVVSVRLPVPKSADDASLRSAAEKIVTDEGYEMNGAAIAVRR